MALVTDEPKRRLRSPARRARIQEVATLLFATVGYAETSLEEIARVVGVTRPVLYDHFSSKKELFLSLLEAQRDAILLDVVSELPGDQPLDERLARAFDAFFESVERHPHAWQMLFRESTADPEILAAQRRIQSEASLAVIGQLAAEGGAFSPGAPDQRLRVLAELWGSALNGLARWWYDAPGVPRAILVAGAMDVVWLGLDRLQAGERWSARSTTASQGSA